MRCAACSTWPYHHAPPTLRHSVGDATAIGYRGQAAELHLAIDPRDADDRSYMIEDLDGLLRLVESRAAEPLWC